MLDTDPGFFGSVCPEKTNPKWGVAFGETGMGWIERKVAKIFCKKTVVALPVVDRNSMAGMVLI